MRYLSGELQIEGASQEKEVCCNQLGPNSEAIMELRYLELGQSFSLALVQYFLLPFGIVI